MRCRRGWMGRFEGAARGLGKAFFGKLERIVVFVAECLRLA